MDDEEFVVGRLFRATNKSGAVTTDPWGSTDRTITYADHVLIESGEIAMLVEYIKIDNRAGIWIWLHQEKVVWQVLSMEKYNKHWKRCPPVK